MKFADSIDSFGSSNWPYVPDQRGYTADTPDLSALVVRPREIKCTRCWFVHRTDQACEEIW